MNKRIQFLLLIGLLCAAQFSFAKQFFLMTVEPGSEFWSVYGHTALVIDDDVYGFGVFSFEQENFYTSFVRNKMSYMVGHTDLESEVYWAEQDHRRLTLMPLNLSEEAKNKIMVYLRWHFLPENQTYAYDYFLQNCATKIRDLLNQAMDGELAAHFLNNKSGSYFSETFPVHNQSMMTFALAVAYGHAAYQPRNDFELMAFPMFLRQALSDDGMSKWRGEIEIKVDPKAKTSWVIFFQTHVFLFTLTLFMLLALAFKASRNFAIKFWLLLQSLIGMVLLFLWFGTEHLMAAWNVQFLIFPPFAALIWFIKPLKHALWICSFSWVPLALWQGSWYLWPLILINLYVFHLMTKSSKS